MNCLRYNFLLLMHSALTPSLLAACREALSDCVCVRVCVKQCVKEGRKEEEEDDGADFCPRPVNLCAWLLFKKGSFAFKKSSCLPHYLLSAM